MSIISPDSVIMKQFKNSKKMSLDKLQADAVKDNEKELVQINRDQMRSGRMGNGFLPDYSPYSQTLKDRSNYKATWPTMDLYKTGSFQKKMYMELTPKSVLFDSRDNKTNDLVRRFSDEIFELDVNSLRLAQEITTPTYNKFVHEKLNK